MSNQQANWAKKLESGQTDDPTLELAAELRQTANRPATAVPSTHFKADLRRRLINQHPAAQKSFWGDFGQRLRSGTAVAVLVVAVMFIWFSLSRPEQADTPSYGDSPAIAGGSENNQTGDVNVIVTPAGETAVASNPTIPTRTPLAPGDGEAIILSGYELPTGPFFTGEAITVTLYWEALNPVQTDWHVSLQLFEQDRLVAQMDESTNQPSSSWGVNERITDTHSLPIPSDMPPGSYRLDLILYNPLTGQRPPYFINGIELRDMVYLVQPTTPIPETAVAAGDTLQIQSITQAARQNSDEPIHYIVEIAYQLQSAEFGLFRLNMAHPNWANTPAPSDASQRLPVDSVTDFIPIANGQGTLILDFVVDPSEKEAILGTTEPVFTAVIMDTEQVNRKTIYTMPTFSEYPLSLENTAVIQYP